MALLNAANAFSLQQQFNGGLAGTTGTLSGSLSAANFLQGSNQVCDASNNCGYATSGQFAGAFIQNGNSFGSTAILGTNDANNLQLETGGTTKLTIQNSTGNVGIGTTAPGAKLDVAGTTGLTFAVGSTGLVSVGTRGTSGGSLFVNTPSLNSSFGSGLGIDGSYTNPGGIGTSVVNDKALGVSSGGGYGSDLAFSTTNNTTLSEVMRLTKSGNVGIGTTAPTAKLEVSDIGNKTNGILSLQSTSPGNDGAFVKFGAFNYFNQNSSGTGYWNWGAAFNGETNLWERRYTSANAYLGNINIGTTSGDVRIGSSTSNLTTDTNPTLTTSLIVKGDTGNVGIGITLPTEKLHVVGKAIITGSLTVGADATFNGSTITFSNNVRGKNIVVPASAATLAVTFGTAQPDASYAVFCTPRDWVSSCSISNQTAAGFTLNFGIAAPGDGSGKVNWFVVR